MEGEKLEPRIIYSEIVVGGCFFLRISGYSISNSNEGSHPCKV
jgi:hypothetical protein